ncbi:MAG: DNA adenine methylase [Hyphomicrobiales bacterium]
MAAPFLKWAGGKAKLAPEVLSRAPERFGRYFEPFLGGGAVYFALAEVRPLAAPVLNDANPDLIACYRALRDSPDAVIERLRPLARGYLEAKGEARAAFYYRVRADAPGCEVCAAARLIFLNRTCYNGLYRVNASGRFNVPHGRYRNPRILDEPRLRAAAEALRGAELCQLDFEAACANARAGDFVYFDPPYQPLSRTARFTAYTSADFGPADQERLRDLFESLARRGVACLLSNSDHEAIRGLYGGRGYTFDTVQMSRAINSVGTGRAPIAELLVSNMARPEVREAFAATPASFAAAR